MEDLIYYSNLYDYYKDLLTEVQRSHFEDYYFNNLSLQEIADNNKVSKSFISKTIIEVNKKLDFYEEVLCLYNNFNQIKDLLDQDNLKKIEEYI